MTLRPSGSPPPFWLGLLLGAILGALAAILVHSWR